MNFFFKNTCNQNRKKNVFFLVFHQFTRYQSLECIYFWRKYRMNCELPQLIFFSKIHAAIKCQKWQKSQKITEKYFLICFREQTELPYLSIKCSVPWHNFLVKVWGPKNPYDEEINLYHSRSLLIILHFDQRTSLIILDKRSVQRYCYCGRT